MNEDKQVTSTAPRPQENRWLKVISGALIGYVLIIILLAGVALFSADTDGLRSFLSTQSPVPLIALGMVYFMLRRSTNNAGEKQP
jgi:hypothetical protein